MAAIAAALAVGVLSGGPAAAGAGMRDDARPHETAGEARAGGAILPVNLAILGLGGVWLVLVVRRMTLRGPAHGPADGRFRDGVPRPVAGGR